MWNNENTCMSNIPQVDGERKLYLATLTLFPVTLIQMLCLTFTSATPISDLDLGDPDLWVWPFWAHLCSCTVGSYASISVCLSLDQKYWKEIHSSATAMSMVSRFCVMMKTKIRNKVYRKWFTFAGKCCQCYMLTWPLCVIFKWNSINKS